MTVKKYGIFFGLFLIFFHCRPTAQENFLRANVAYKKGDFKAALHDYQLIENKGAAVWYNMGNCYYHQEQYVDALVSWKRALKNGGSFLQSAIDHNCYHSYQKLGMSVPNSFLHFLQQKINYFSFFQWQLAFLIMLYTFLLIIILQRRKQKKQFFIHLFLSVLIFLNASCLGIKYWNATQIIGLIKHESSLIAGTDERFSKIGNLLSGQEVIIKERKDQWCKIQNNDQIGWVLAENVEFI